MSSGTLSPGAANEKMPCLVRNLLLITAEASKRNLDAALASGKRINWPQDIESKKIIGVPKTNPGLPFFGQARQGRKWERVEQAGIIAQAFTEGTGMGRPASNNVREGE
jgi:hypothetical protein